MLKQCPRGTALSAMPWRSNILRPQIIFQREYFASAIRPSTSLLLPLSHKPGSLLTTRGTHIHEVANSAMASSRAFSASWMWICPSYAMGGYNRKKAVSHGTKGSVLNKSNRTNFLKESHPQMHLHDRHVHHALSCL